MIPKSDRMEEFYINRIKGGLRIIGLEDAIKDTYMLAACIASRGVLFAEKCLV